MNPTVCGSTKRLAELRSRAPRSEGQEEPSLHAGSAFRKTRIDRYRVMDHCDPGSPAVNSVMPLAPLVWTFATLSHRSPLPNRSQRAPVHVARQCEDALPPHPVRHMTASACMGSMSP